jgi:hypothetical protein
MEIERLLFVCSGCFLGGYPLGDVAFQDVQRQGPGAKHDVVKSPDVEAITQLLLCPSS